jgi:hypothetical protein
MKLKVGISEINALYLSILSLIQNVFTLFLHSLKNGTDSVALSIAIGMVEQEEVGR